MPLVESNTDEIVGTAVFGKASPPSHGAIVIEADQIFVAILLISGPVENHSLAIGQIYRCINFVAHFRCLSGSSEGVFHSVRVRENSLGEIDYHCVEHRKAGLSDAQPA